METKVFNKDYDYIIDYCAIQIKKGNIGIFPTDTVYGIGCDALNISSIQNLFSIKNRNLNKPINVLVSNLDMLKNLIYEINPIEEKLIKNYWPGDLTIIFNKSNIVPDILTSGLDTIGVRMPNNKICLELIEKFGSPIATSSANLADESPDSNINNLLSDFNNKVSFIIDTGILDKNLPSTIVKVENNEIKILRQGDISVEDIKKCFGGNINVR